MPGSSKAKHPRGHEIEFFEDSHVYKSIIDGKEIKYTSGTGVIHHCFPPFDPSGEITKRCALKEGISVDELKARWKAKGDASCKFGTRVHECCEDVELGKSLDELRNKPSSPKEEKLMANAIKMAKKFYERLYILGAEKIVFSPSLQIAGTVDLLARSKKDGSYLIIDWKTNKSIDVEDKWNKFALDPISHLHDTNYVQYCCQLNLYQYLLRREKYVPIDAKFKMFLVHVTEQDASLISVPDMQLEIRDMMIHWLLERADYGT